MNVVHDIDIKLLRIFQIVAQEQGFSRAAEHLNTSPPKISMNMAQLESRLEMRLCERGVKGFRLTDQGKQVLAACDNLFEELEHFRSHVKSIADARPRDFRIGFLSEATFEEKMQIPALLKEMESAFQGLFFHVEFAEAALLKEKVEAGNMDCAVGYFNNLSASLEARYLFTERHLCYCGNKHELFDVPYDEIRLDSLQNCKLAGYDDLADEEKRVVPLFNKFESCSRSGEGIVALILTGQFVGLLQESLAQIWLDRGMIRVLDREELELLVDIKMIYQSSRTDEPVMRTLLEIVNKLFPVSRNTS